MTFTIVTSPDKDRNYAVTEQVIELIKGLGGEVYQNTNPADDVFCDFFISIGGDGTYLSASARAIRLNVPMVGINLGTRGFLPEVEKNNLGVLERLFTGDYKIEKRMLLNAKIVAAGNVICDELALNDITIHRGFSPSLLTLEILANNQPITNIRGDGLIVSTPTGSTAYSLASGGPIIDTNAKCISVVPICAHSLNNRPIVFDENAVLTIMPELRDGKKASLSVDGREYKYVSPDMEVIISSSQKKLSIVRLTDNSFYEILEKKMGG